MWRYACINFNFWSKSKIIIKYIKVYSFGCDDKGVLGRPNVEGEDARLPALITDLPPVDMIACGSSHSVAANS